MAKNFQKQKRISYTLATLFSGEKVGNEYQMVKVGYYDEKLTFNFYKGTTGSASKMQEAFVRFDFEIASSIIGVFETIIRDRVGTYRSGDTYKDNVHADYSIRYTDSDSGQLRTLGHIIIETELINDRYCVVLKYNDGKDEYRIVLASPAWIGESFQLEPESFISSNIDFLDARLYAFTYVLSGIYRCWPILVQNDIIARYQLNRLSAIAEKLGINSKGGGNYNDKSYRSNKEPSRQVEYNSNDSEDEPF